MSNRVTDRVADRLSESLRCQADRLEPGPSLTDVARQRARRIRRNRRIGTAAACLVVLAVAVPFGLLGTGDSPRKTENVPIERPEPTPTRLPQPNRFEDPAKSGKHGYLVIDAATGEESHRSNITDGKGPVPVGFLGDGVLFGDAPFGRTWTALWDPDTDPGLSLPSRDRWF